MVVGLSQMLCILASSWGSVLLFINLSHGLGHEIVGLATHADNLTLEGLAVLHPQNGRSFLRIAELAQILRHFCELLLALLVEKLSTAK